MSTLLTVSCTCTNHQILKKRDKSTFNHKSAKKHQLSGSLLVRGGGFVPAGAQIILSVSILDS